ncbi:MAG: hypothetical protein ACOYEB_08220 [Enterococcus lemanii]
MPKQSIKWLLVVVSAFAALSVIFIGLKGTKDQVASETTPLVQQIQSEQTKLTKIKRQLEAAYLDEAAGFLKPAVTSEEMAKLKTTIERLKDFSEEKGLGQADAKKAFDAFTENRLAVNQQLTQILLQLKIQSQLATLFTEPNVAIQTVNDQLVLGLEVNKDQLNEVKENLSYYKKENQWQKNAFAYYHLAQKQWDEIEAIKAQMKQALNAPESLTQSNYEQIVARVKQLPSEDWQAQFQTSLAELQTALLNQQNQVTEDTTTDNNTDDFETNNNNNNQNLNPSIPTPNIPTQPNNPGSGTGTGTGGQTPTPTPTPEPEPEPTPEPEATPDSGTAAPQP